MKARYSSVSTPLGRRFSKACALLCISKAEAGRQMGYRYYPSLAAILAGRPGCAGPKSLGRVEKWLKKVESK